MDPQEYGIGDKAYIGCPELICEFKKTKTKKVLMAAELEHNLILQHYRGRNEHMVGECVDGKEALCGKWRGNYSLICAIVKLTVHMSTLQERMKGPRYDVYGPWPHFPGAGMPQSAADPAAQAIPATPVAAAVGASESRKPSVGDVWFVPAFLWPNIQPGNTEYGLGWLGSVLRLPASAVPSVVFRCRGEISNACMQMDAFIRYCKFIVVAASSTGAASSAGAAWSGGVASSAGASDGDVSPDDDFTDDDDDYYADIPPWHQRHPPPITGAYSALTHTHTHCSRAHCSWVQARQQQVTTMVVLMRTVTVCHHRHHGLLLLRCRSDKYDLWCLCRQRLQRRLTLRRW